MPLLLIPLGLVATGYVVDKTGEAAGQIGVAAKWITMGGVAYLIWRYAR